MWLMGTWIPVTKEILYGIGFVIFVAAIVVIVVRKKMTATKLPKFPARTVFKGAKLDKAEQDLPIVELPWDKKGKKKSKDDFDDKEFDEEDSDDEDDGYTVVEKTIQSGKPQMLKTPAPPARKEPKENKEKPLPVAKKGPDGDKMDFFTTNKNAL